MQEATFNQSDIVEVTSATVEELKQKAKAAPRGRYRLCLHRSTQDQVQEMVIVAPRGTYFRPHRHPAGKSESYHVVEGSMTVFFFNDAGEVIRRIDMAAHGTAGADSGGGKTYLYRLSNRIWHIPVPTSDFVVYHEVYCGPFDRDADCEYAPFSPPEEARADVDRFLADLMTKRP
jgi:cupin fold WbuC family metalloprotein